MTDGKEEAQAVITRKGGFAWAPEGHTVVTIPEGTIVRGYAATLAINAGAARDVRATESPAPENKAMRPPQVKRGKRRA